jgi:hypothetical protein
VKRLKLKKLLKFFFVFVILAALFKLQYSNSSAVRITKLGFYAGIVSPFSPAQDTPSPEKPLYQKDVIRLEIFFLFFVFLTYFVFSFSIFQFRTARVWIPEKEIPDRYFPRRLKDRAPPFFRF